MTTGFRGGYAPFYEAVRILSERGVFDPSEVSDFVQTTSVSKFKRDEMERKFEDGYFTGVDFHRVGPGLISVTFDPEDTEADTLFVETFEIESNYTNSKLWEHGTGDLEVTGDGEIFQIQTVCHAGDERSSDFNKPRELFRLTRRRDRTPAKTSGRFKTFKRVTQSDQGGVQ